MCNTTRNIIFNKAIIKIKRKLNVRIPMLKIPPVRPVLEIIMKIVKKIIGADIATLIYISISVSEILMYLSLSSL